MSTIETASLKENIRQIPITIITGFLGAGKTTLLNYILKSEHGLKPAVLVNDFGAINIDADLIEKIDEEEGTINLSNGCICCSIRGDLIGAVIKQYTRPDPPNYIIIECSGVSDPMEVVTTFISPVLKTFIRVDGIIAVVDAEQIVGLSAKYASLARMQIESATIVIINKADLVSNDELFKLKEWVRDLSPGARILEAQHGRVPLEFILGVGNYDPFTVIKNTQFRSSELKPKLFGLNQQAVSRSNHHDIFSSFSFTSDEPLSLFHFKEIIQQLPPTIYRAKGTIYFSDIPELEHIFHVVGRWAYINPGKKWCTKKPVTHLVMIGEQGSIDEIVLNEQMDGCLQKNVSFHRASTKKITRKFAD